MPAGRDRGRVRRNPYSDTSSKQEEEDREDSGSERHMDSKRPIDSGGEQIAKDTSGPQLSKEDGRSMMESEKRLDEVQPGTGLNEGIIDHYHEAGLVGVGCHYLRMPT